jgi:hypothetical protein
MEIRNYRWVAVPIYLTIGVEKQHIIADAVRQISELRDELGVRESSAATPNRKLIDEIDTAPECYPAS